MITALTGFSFLPDVDEQDLSPRRVKRSGVVPSSTGHQFRPRGDGNALASWLHGGGEFLALLPTEHDHGPEQFHTHVHDAAVQPEYALSHGAQCEQLPL